MKKLILYLTLLIIVSCNDQKPHDLNDPCLDKLANVEYSTKNNLLYVSFDGTCVDLSKGVRKYVKFVSQAENEEYKFFNGFIAFDEFELGKCSAKFVMDHRFLKKDQNYQTLKRMNTFSSKIRVHAKVLKHNEGHCFLIQNIEKIYN